jgi:hypothetical protein
MLMMCIDYVPQMRLLQLQQRIETLKANTGAILNFASKPETPNISQRVPKRCTRSSRQPT